MFFQGSLQEGISTALQQSKQVVCFVTDDGDESQKWENEFLTDDSIRPGLESSSVLLRLLAGSEEAGYLEALFPVPKKPTIVVIQNGQLREYIAAGTSKEEFVRTLGKSIPSDATQQSQGSATPVTTASAPNQQNPPSQPSQTNDSLYDDETQPTATSNNNSGPPQTPATSSGDEEKRFTAEQKGKARAEAEQEAKRRVDERCGCESTNPEQAHANEIKIRKQQANEERKRILKRIEDDKRARKEREAAERKARLLQQQQSSTPDSNNSEATEPPTSSSLRERKPKAGTPGAGGDHCSLQVRLLDGTTIRTRFASDKTLGSDVRKWVDAERTDGDAPYSFRVVLTPRPNKVVQPQEEIKSLLSLGLAPSATLVLIPNKYTSAYARGNGGMFGSIIGAFSMLYGAILASLGGFFSLFFGGGGGDGGNGNGNGNGSAGQNLGGSDIPMENLRARRRDPQFYNGNSLSFEPRNEDDDDEHNMR
ncbi:hypothetical protein F5Y08DRAFT_123468 [Xylaria arbuscula]|nr:hypothetical protein F5Y08DRAFT_123468 [Xylaria arbuscula]